MCNEFGSRMSLSLLLNEIDEIYDQGRFHSILVEIDCRLFLNFSLRIFHKLRKLSYLQPL